VNDKFKSLEGIILSNSSLPRQPSLPRVRDSPAVRPQEGRLGKPAFGQSYFLTLIMHQQPLDGYIVPVLRHLIRQTNNV
jgi:hypothetical protein